MLCCKDSSLFSSQQSQIPLLLDACRAEQLWMQAELLDVGQHEKGGFCVSLVSKSIIFLRFNQELVYSLLHLGQ
ncbi:MAG: hypothetical protein ACK55I_33505, partial [bacterium]